MPPLEDEEDKAEDDTEEVFRVSPINGMALTR